MLHSMCVYGHKVYWTHARRSMRWRMRSPWPRSRYFLTAFTAPMEIWMYGDMDDGDMDIWRYGCMEI